MAVARHHAMPSDPVTKRRKVPKVADQALKEGERTVAAAGKRSLNCGSTGRAQWPTEAATPHDPQRPGPSRSGDTQGPRAEDWAWAGRSGATQAQRGRGPSQAQAEAAPP